MSYKSYKKTGAAILVFLFALFGSGCRHDVTTGEQETINVPITPLHIGPRLLPFGEEPVSTYGISAGLTGEEIDSLGIFAPLVKTEFSGRNNYGVACSLLNTFDRGWADFNGIAVGALNLVPHERMPGPDSFHSSGWGFQNGICIFLADYMSDTTGLSAELFAAGKVFDGIDICLCSTGGTWGGGLQVTGLDCSDLPLPVLGDNGSRITGCQIGGVLRSAVHGAQIGLITRNPGVPTGKRGELTGKCLSLGILNFELTEGFQVGAVNNTSEGNPVQIGLFNTTFDGSPFQVGLLNINPNGFLPIFPFFNYSVKKGAYEREQESAVGF